MIVFVMMIWFILAEGYCHFYFSPRCFGLCRLFSSLSACFFPISSSCVFGFFCCRHCAVLPSFSLFAAFSRNFHPFLRFHRLFGRCHRRLIFFSAKGKAKHVLPPLLSSIQEGKSTTRRCRTDGDGGGRDEIFAFVNCPPGGLRKSSSSLEGRDANRGAAEG